MAVRLVSRAEAAALVASEVSVVALREENCRFVFSKVSAEGPAGDAEDRGDGILYLTADQLLWVPEGVVEGNAAIAISYPDIILHAVSRDRASFPSDCIYCQLAAASRGEEDDEDATPIEEMRIVPAAAGSVDEIFRVMTEMAATHPDEEGGDGLLSSSSEDGEEDWAPGTAVLEDAEEDQEG